MLRGKDEHKILWFVKGKLKEIKGQDKYKKYLSIIEELEEIYGIGRKKAYELISVYGIQSIEQLKKAVYETINLIYKIWVIYHL